MAALTLILTVAGYIFTGLGLFMIGSLVADGLKLLGRIIR